MATKNYSLSMFTSSRMVQMLIGLLFIAMGLIGFSTRGGLGGDFAGELAGIFGGGNSDLIISGVSAILLVCGLMLLSALWVRGIPAKFISIAKITTLTIWLALIIVLDILVANFGSMNGSEWFIWIEQVVIHLIVLVSIMTIKEA